MTYKVADDANLTLKKFGEFLYDNIIVFAPTVEEFGGALRDDNIIFFVSFNLFLCLSEAFNLSDIKKVLQSTTHGAQSTTLVQWCTPFLFILFFKFLQLQL